MSVKLVETFGHVNLMSPLVSEETIAIYESEVDEDGYDMDFKFFYVYDYIIQLDKLLNGFKDPIQKEREIKTIIEEAFLLWSSGFYNDTDSGYQEHLTCYIHHQYTFDLLNDIINKYGHPQNIMLVLGWKDNILIIGVIV